MIATDAASGETFELVRQTFTRFGACRIERERLVVYGLETAEGLRSGKPVMHPAWWQNLLEPIGDSEVVARLQNVLAGALERAQRERLVAM